MRKKVSALALEIRAGELADTGKYSDWVDVAEALLSEGYTDPAGRLRKTPGLPAMLDVRCAQAKRNA